MTIEEVRDRLRSACKAMGTAKAWAEQHGCSGAYVSDVLSGRREPGEAILRPLGLSKVVAYVDISHVTDADGVTRRLSSAVRVF